MGKATAQRVRAGAVLAALLSLAACAGQPARPSASVAAAQAPASDAVEQAAALKEKAKSSYAPPGPPSDPWGPYIIEASHRFDMPQGWIRAVMQVESNGVQFRADGTLTISPVGAMGLMQLMPDTYREMQARYQLGDDPYEPHNNILAGTAYLREMYDAFGTPAFLAAYNAGPTRLAAYLSNQRSLPDETRRYVRLIAPHLGGEFPASRSPAEQLALNQIPVDVPPGLRWGRHRTQYVSRNGHGRTQLAQAHPSVGSNVRVQPAASSAVEVAEAPEPVAKPSGMGLISPAMASERVAQGGRNWAVQIGAYGDAGQARAAANAASAAAGSSHAMVAPLKTAHATLYRARLGGLTHAAAIAACQHLAHRNGGCMVVSPASL